VDNRLARKTRVVLVVPQERIPIWLRNLVSGLQEAEEVDLVSVFVVADGASVARPSLLFRAWKRLDDWLYLMNLPGCRHTDNITDLGVPYRCKSLDDIDVQDSDVVAWMCPHRPPAGLISKTNVGFWSIAEACRPEFGLPQFIGRQAATECAVIQYGRSAGEDRILATGAAATDKLILSRGLVGLRAVAKSLFLSTLSRLQSHGEVGEVGASRDKSYASAHAMPGLFEFVLGLMRLYGSYCIGFPSRFFYFDQWQMAYRIGGERLDQRDLIRLAPDHRGFWADPFVLEMKGRKVLFFEELSEESGRGHISAMELLPDGRFDSPVRVLARPYHLSYPFLFEFGGSAFMIPESAEAKRVEVYRCTLFPFSWEPHTTLLEDVSAYDPTLVEHDGMWWMFLTIQHDGNSPNDELHLYFADSPFGDWTSHPLNPICLDVRCARPAGQLFRANGKLYRPAQDCSGRYGRAIVIQEVRQMTTTAYEELPAQRISAAWADGAHATHTLNQSAGVTVYDCEVMRRK
jgi:hypothetical protein